MLISPEKKYFATQVIGLFDWSFCCCEKLEKTLFHQFDVTSAPQQPTISGRFACFNTAQPTLMAAVEGPWLVPACLRFGLSHRYTKHVSLV
jgi:hypothetical protein